MTLSDWQKAGRLTEHRTSAREIADLLALVERDLVASQLPALDADWRLNIAYNAALQAATAALAACGYRAAREAHHYHVIQSLALTIGAGSSTVAQMDGFRRKRNLGAYERAGLASDQEAQEMIALAIDLRARVMRWLESTHPELLAQH
ncbi:MAG: hypothetical protein ACYC4R_02845 [Anaerolineae bacterium]